MLSYSQIITTLKVQTDRVLLWHSATGKDSIMLLDLLCKAGIKVTPVFMYYVPDLNYENRYISWAERKYGVKFIKTPHFGVYSAMRRGSWGVKKDATVKRTTLGKIDELIRRQTGINYSVYGMKKNDGLHRRLMLNTYIEGYHSKSNKFYPLMDYRQAHIRNYIQENDLIKPFSYNSDNSSGGIVTDPEYLACLRIHYPDDLQKVFKQYPQTEITLFKYDNYGKSTPEGENKAK